MMVAVFKTAQYPTYSRTEETTLTTTYEGKESILKTVTIITKGIAIFLTLKTPEDGQLSRNM
jgi:hypothetical protein